LAWASITPANVTASGWMLAANIWVNSSVAACDVRCRHAVDYRVARSKVVNVHSQQH
jgi:hypothetical protein